MTTTDSTQVSTEAARTLRGQQAVEDLFGVRPADQATRALPAPHIRAILSDDRPRVRLSDIPALAGAWRLTGATDGLQADEGGR